SPSRWTAKAPPTRSHTCKPPSTAAPNQPSPSTCSARPRPRPPTPKNNPTAPTPSPPASNPQPTRNRAVPFLLPKRSGQFETTIYCHAKKCLKTFRAVSPIASTRQAERQGIALGWRPGPPPRHRGIVDKDDQTSVSSPWHLPRVDRGPNRTDFPPIKCPRESSLA